MTSLHTQSGELGLIAVKGLAPSFHKGRVRFRPLRSSRRLRPLAQRVPGSHVIGGLRLVAPNCPPTHKILSLGVTNRLNRTYSSVSRI